MLLLPPPPLLLRQLLLLLRVPAAGSDVDRLLALLLLRVPAAGPDVDRVLALLLLRVPTAGPDVGRVLAPLLLRRALVGMALHARPLPLPVMILAMILPSHAILRPVPNDPQPTQQWLNRPFHPLLPLLLLPSLAHADRGPSLLLP